MKKNNQARKDLKYDLKEMCFRLLSQWKAILVVAVLMALLVCAYKYRGDMAVYHMQLAVQQETMQKLDIPEDQQIEEILNSLTEEDRIAVGYVLRGTEWLESRTKYLYDSILLKTDPSNQKILSMKFAISTDGSDVSPLYNLYNEYLYGNDMAEKAAQYIEAGADAKYIKELFFKDDASGSPQAGATAAVLTWNTVLPEEADSEAVAKGIEEIVRQYSDQLQSVSPHSVTITKKEESHIYSAAAADKKTGLLGEIYSMENIINARISALTPTQAAAWNSILSIKNNFKNAGNQEQTAVTIPVPGPNLFYAIIGFIAGAFIYAAVYLLYLMARDRFISAAQADDVSRLLGELYYRKVKKGWKKIFHSNKVDAIHYRGKEDLQRQLDKLAEKLRAVCGYEASDSVTMFKVPGYGKDSKLDEAAAEIVQKAKESGISIDTEEITEDFSEEKMPGIENAVILIEENADIRDVNKVFATCGAYDTNIIGSIYVSEY